MKVNDFYKQLLVEFLSDNFELFQAFLSRHDIEESEAEGIVANLRQV